MKTLALTALLIAACTPAPERPDDGGAPTPDAAGAAPDLAGCSPSCGGLTPVCNASRHCVGCTADGECAHGEYCKIVSDAIASGVARCVADATCGNAQTGC